MTATANPFDLPSPTIHWGTRVGTGTGDLTPDPSAKDKVEQALIETVDNFLMNLSYRTGEEARDWADAIQSLCAGLANLDVIEDA